MASQTDVELDHLAGSRVNCSRNIVKSHGGPNKPCSTARNPSECMSAPNDLVVWMHEHRHKDKKLPHFYLYHSRSDAHSVQLSELITRDLLRSCPSIRHQAALGHIAYGVNVEHFWKSSGKAKSLDLAIGLPKEKPMITGDIAKVKSNRRRSGELPSVDRNVFSRILIACEAKAVMTEHGKSQPRIFDELSSSHEIVHQGDPAAIAAGIVMVNVAATFASPLRQQDATMVYFSRHKQPLVTQRMINHLRGLKIRDGVDDVGFDAFCTFVVDCDNQSQCLLHTTPPAPQKGDKDHYDTFGSVKYFV